MVGPVASLNAWNSRAIPLTRHCAMRAAMPRFLGTIGNHPFGTGDGFEGRPSANWPAFYFPLPALSRKWAWPPVGWLLFDSGQYNRSVLISAIRVRHAAGSRFCATPRLHALLLAWLRFWATSPRPRVVTCGLCHNIGWARAPRWDDVYRTFPRRRLGRAVPRAETMRYLRLNMQDHIRRGVLQGPSPCSTLRLRLHSPRAGAVPRPPPRRQRGILPCGFHERHAAQFTLR